MIYVTFLQLGFVKFNGALMFFGKNPFVKGVLDLICKPYFGMDFSVHTSSGNVVQSPYKTLMTLHC
jgi:hypothetical protein